VAAQQAPAASNVTVKELLDWLMPRLDAAGHSEMVQAQVQQLHAFACFVITTACEVVPGCHSSCNFKCQG
jgi:hypothetical protein